MIRNTELGIVAMIPARMGSKRIPRKNLRPFCGKPLIQYAIDLARGCEYFKEIWVNSESDLLGQLAIASGVRFHKRPEELSSDTATNQQFTAEFLEHHPCDFVVMVNTTSPLLKQETLREFCTFLRSNQYDTVLSVSDQYAECFFDGEPVNFSLDRKVNSQCLTPVREVVWALTAWRREYFLGISRRGLCGTYSGRLGLFPIPKDEACDLDTMQDWIIAEAIMKARSEEDKPHKLCTPEMFYEGGA